MASHVPLSPLLSLPRELRYEIYDHLYGKEPRSYPYKAPPITSFDQTPPPTELQLTCRSIFEEIRTYFWGRVTPRLVAQSITRTTRNDIHPLTLRAIQQAKKVELVLIWYISRQFNATRSWTWPRAMTEWLAEMVDLLLQEGQSLESVIVSVRDAEEDVEWTKKAGLLQPLNKLKGRVEFRVGEIVAADWQEEELREKLREYLRELNR